MFIIFFLQLLDMIFEINKFKPIGVTPKKRCVQKTIYIGVSKFKISSLVSRLHFINT